MKGFPIQSIPHAKICVGLYINFPLLLSDFNKKRNVKKNFSNTCGQDAGWSPAGQPLTLPGLLLHCNLDFFFCTQPTHLPDDGGSMHL